MRNSATNHYDMSLSRFYGSFAPVVSDPRLRSVGIANFNSPSELVFHLFVRGSVVQCAALLDHLDATCDLAMPEISTLNRDVAQEAIISGITQCCDFLGVNFAGDLPVFSVMAFDMYKGLSILEWMRFFDGVRKGRWKSDYQNVSVRGLNPEFLLDWLEKFGEGRDHVVQSLRREIPDAKPEPVDPTALERFKEMQRAEAIMCNRVAEHRGAIERARLTRMVEKRSIPMPTEQSMLYTKALDVLNSSLKSKEFELTEALKKALPERIEYLEKEVEALKVKIKQQQTLEMSAMKWVDEDFVFEADAKGANYKRVQEALEIYYLPFYPGVTAKQVIDRIIARWDLEHILEGGEVKEAFYNTEAKKLHKSMVTALEGQENAIVLAGLNHLLEKSASPAIFLENIGRPSPGVKSLSESSMMKLANWVCNSFTSQKYIAHCEKRFEQGGIPLYKKEYKVFCALWFYVNHCGLEHPLHHIFND